MSQRDLIRAYPQEVKELQTLLDKADKDDPKSKDRRALALFLSKHPHLWRYVGDFMEQAALNLVDTMQSTPVARTAISAAADELPHDLALPGDGELERLLIQQIVLCWLRLAYVEHQFTGATMKGDNTMTQVQHWDKRLNAAQRRYLRAIETLARVRKLGVPAVQVNIAQQQVNQVNSV